jgi:hypothetical protein
MPAPLFPLTVAPGAANAAGFKLNAELGQTFAGRSSFGADD